jgi:hypothetical protein
VHPEKPGKTVAPMMEIFPKQMIENVLEIQNSSQGT